MTTLGIISLVSGILGVILTIKQSIWCWPAALVSVITSGVEFYFSRLYGDMSLQVFYFISGIYGWYYWDRNKNKTFIVTNIPGRYIITISFITVVLTIAFYFILKFFKGDKIIFDAILTACSITATYMMTKKWIENWLFWVVIDGAYIILYGLKGLWLYALLYFIFTLMAAYGYYAWRKIKS